MYGTCCIDKDIVAKHMTGFQFLVQFNSNSSTTQQYTDILTDPFKEYATNTKIQYWLQLPTITCVMDSLDTSVC